MCDIITKGFPPYCCHNNRETKAASLWDHGWSLEDTHWCLEARLYKELDLLTRICPNPRYLTWWNLSNKYGDTIYFCEIMAIIIRHASLLKCDDARLKRLARGNSTCSLCDLYVIEDVYHIITQCPGTQLLRREMFNELESDADVHAVLVRNAHDYLFTCLGMHHKDGTVDVMDRLLSNSGKHIYISMCLARDRMLDKLFLIS